MDEWILRAGKTLLTAARCIDCHDPSGASRAGPRIPFADPEALAAYMKHAEQKGRPLPPVVRELISDRAPESRRMPRAGRNLRPEEQEWLMRYLESLAPRAGESLQPE